MPSDAAMRTARAIIVAELDSIDDRFGPNITDVEMAEIIDREMGRCEACDGDDCDICDPQKSENST